MPDQTEEILQALFSKAERITSTDVAQALGLSARMARVLLREWVNQGWLKMVNASNRARGYELSAIHWKFIGNPRFRKRTLLKEQVFVPPGRKAAYALSVVVDPPTF